MATNTRHRYNHSWTDSFKSVDLFGASPSLQVKGRRLTKSFCGAIVSFLLGTIIVMYMLLKLMNMLEINGLIGMANEPVDLEMEFDL